MRVYDEITVTVLLFAFASIHFLDPYSFMVDFWGLCLSNFDSHDM